MSLKSTLAQAINHLAFEIETNPDASSDWKLGFFEGQIAILRGLLIDAEPTLRGQTASRAIIDARLTAARKGDYLSDGDALFLQDDVAVAAAERGEIIPIDDPRTFTGEPEPEPELEVVSVEPLQVWTTVHAVTLSDGATVTAMGAPSDAWHGLAGPLPAHVIEALDALESRDGDDASSVEDCLEALEPIPFHGCGDPECCPEPEPTRSQLFMGRETGGRTLGRGDHGLAERAAKRAEQEAEEAHDRQEKSRVDWCRDAARSEAQEDQKERTAEYRRTI